MTEPVKFEDFLQAIRDAVYAITSNYGMPQLWTDADCVRFLETMTKLGHPVWPLEDEK